MNESTPLKIRAFGKMVDRDEAYQIIINDKLCEFVYAANTDGLEDLLLYGWKSLEEWSDQELEDFIDELCVENQPGGQYD